MTRGFAAVPIQGAYGHKFGGGSWLVADETDTTGLPPTLLVVLDLADPLVTELRTPCLETLPLASCVNDSRWCGEQVFRVRPDSGVVTLESTSVRAAELLDPPDRLPNPLPVRQLALRSLVDDEDPSVVGDIRASDTFVGGSAFIRVLGTPVWLQGEIRVNCECGLSMRHAASIGYEVIEGSLFERPFFIGEGALYFFWCAACLRVVVRSQST